MKKFALAHYFRTVGFLKSHSQGDCTIKGYPSRTLVR